MAVNPLEKLPKLPQAPVTPKAPQPQPQEAGASKAAPVAVKSAGKTAPPPKPKVPLQRSITVKAEGLRQSRADQVQITARKDQGKFGHVQKAHTPAPKPAPKAAPIQVEVPSASGKPQKVAVPAPKAPQRHAINIVG